jgi:hypothetical protein
VRRRHKDAGAGDAEDKNKKRVVESEVVAAGSGQRAAGCGLRAAGCGFTSNTLNPMGIWLPGYRV